MSREAHVRICGGRRVRFPPATRQLSSVTFPLSIPARCPGRARSWMSAANAFASASRSNVRDSRGPPAPAGRHLTRQLTLPDLVSASFDIHSVSRALAMPPRPLRLPFYRNAGGAGEKPAPQAVVYWQASRREHRVRSAESDRHGQLRGAHHRGPRAELSSPRPGHTATRRPASSADQPTSAPPAPRPSPPSRGDRQPAAPTSRLQDHRREPREGSAWLPREGARR